jgi:hypothetical protein
MSASTGKPMPSPQRTRRFVSNFTSSLIFGAPYRSGKGKAMLKEADKLNSYNEGDLTRGSTPAT